MEHELDIDEVQHAVRLLRQLDAMRKTKKECDLVIKVDGEELPVHRNVMRANSDYFDVMLSHDTIENQSGVVEMKEVKFAPVKKCVDYFYTGKLSTSLGKCEELLYTAGLMQIKPVCEKITPFLENQLNSKSFFKIKKAAAKFDLDDLNKICDDFAKEKFNLISKEKGFEELELEYVSYLITMSRSSEDCKVEAVLLWIEADVENRQKHLIPLMHNVVLEKVSPQYGMSLVQNERLCNESVECMKMLYLAGMKKMSDGEDSGPNAILMFDFASKCLQAYYPTKKTWKRMHPLHEDFVSQKLRYTAVALSGFVYVLMENRRVYRLCVNDKQSKWEAMSDMLVSHGPWMSATTLDDCIYVTSNRSIERYCESKNNWEKIECGDCCCNENELVQFNGSLYSVGGASGRSASDKAYRYNATSATWSRLDSLRHACGTPAAAVYKNKIFLAGGISDGSKQTVSFYEPISNAWTETAPMTRERNLFRLLVIQDKLYAIGHDESPLDIEVYDPNENIWKKIVDKPTMKIMAQATVGVYLK